MRADFGLSDPLELMSPVHIPRGFTKAFIRGDVVEDLGARIDAAYRSLSEGRAGRPHRGHRACRRRRRHRAVQRPRGGPARCAGDHRQRGRRGPAHRRDRPQRGALRPPRRARGRCRRQQGRRRRPTRRCRMLLRLGLARHGIELLGVLPYRRILSHPTLSMLIEQMHGELLHPGDDLDRVIEHVAIGAMHPRHVLERIGPGSLLILPGDRHDIIVGRARRQPHAAGAARDARAAGTRLRYRSHFGRAASDPSAVVARRPRLLGRHPASRARPRGHPRGRPLRLLPRSTRRTTWPARSTTCSSRRIRPTRPRSRRRSGSSSTTSTSTRLLERLDRLADGARRPVTAARRRHPQAGRSGPARWLRAALDRWRRRARGADAEGRRIARPRR